MGGREGEDGNFCLKRLSERREATEGVEEKEKERALKGDNKEPLKEQMKMSFSPPHLCRPTSPPPSCRGDNERGKGESDIFPPRVILLSLSPLLFSPFFIVFSPPLRLGLLPSPLCPPLCRELIPGRFKTLGWDWSWRRGCALPFLSQ